MSDTTAQSGGAADPSQGGGSQEQKPKADPNTQVTVDRSAEEYAQRLKETSNEAKKYRQENSDLKKRLEELEQKSLTEQGNWKEIAEKAQKKLAETQAELKTTRGNFAFKSVSTQLATEALKLGCIDTDALIKLAEIGELEVGEDYSVDADSMKGLLEGMQKSKPWLFKKADPKIQDGVPGKQAPAQPKKLSEMSLEEKMRLLETK